MKIILLRPRRQKQPVPGILWIHGGGYSMGMPSMVHVSCGKTLARKYGAVVVSPGYRLSGKAPYPAALEDCMAALAYMDENREELGISRIIVGGESAGGGLAAAVCLRARDCKGPRIDLQLPLYPMLDCEDTPSSQNNHGLVWNTRRNHRAWRRYLGPLSSSAAVPVYASPAREEDLSGMPPCYTFVCEREPFFSETMTYVSRLREAGVKAQADVYSGNLHAFDMLLFTKKSKLARAELCRVCEPYFAPQKRV